MKKICPYCHKEFDENGLKYHINYCYKNPESKNFIDKEKLQKIYDYYFKEENSIKDVCEHFSLCKVSLNNIFTTEGWKFRNTSEGGIIAHKKYHGNFNHSEETKNKMRKKRLSFMKSHPEQTDWRQRNGYSYPEKLFRNLIEKNSLDKKYTIEKEFSVFPYFIDFAFLEIKLAVEIDGSQHWLEKDRIESDKKKDELLKSLG